VLLFTPGVKEVVQGNSWMLFPAFLLSMGLLIALHVKRKETPINLILLAAFTVVEVMTGPYKDLDSSQKMCPAGQMLHQTCADLLFLLKLTQLVSW